MRFPDDKAVLVSIEFHLDPDSPLRTIKGQRLRDLIRNEFLDILHCFQVPVWQILDVFLNALITVKLFVVHVT